MKFQDKIVLVTGSSRGIGRAIAIAFAQEGANVVVNCDKAEKEAEAVAEAPDEMDTPDEVEGGQEEK